MSNLNNQAALRYHRISGHYSNAPATAHIAKLQEFRDPLVFLPLHRNQQPNTRFEALPLEQISVFHFQKYLFYETRQNLIRKGGLKSKKKYF